MASLRFLLFSSERHSVEFRCQLCVALPVINGHALFHSCFDSLIQQIFHEHLLYVKHSEQKNLQSWVPYRLVRADGNWVLSKILGVLACDKSYRERTLKKRRKEYIVCLLRRLVWGEIFWLVNIWAKNLGNWEGDSWEYLWENIQAKE